MRCSHGSDSLSFNTINGYKKVSSAHSDIYIHLINTLTSGRIWGFSCQNNQIACGFAGNG